MGWNPFKKATKWIGGAVKKVGNVGRKVSRVVGKVAGAIDSPIGRMITSAGSKLPVIGSAFSWARDVAPQVKKATDLVEEGFKFGEDVHSAVKNRDLSQVGALAKRGAGLYNQGKSYAPNRPVMSRPVISRPRPAKGSGGVPVMSMDDL